MHDWTRSLDNGEQVDVFILDFEKAFDTVTHKLLKSKLNQYGTSIQVIKWSDSFLCYRSQCVVVNGSKSSSSPVLSGVPQGTVLGPLLLSIYINDIVKVVSSVIRLFADDCVCYRTIKSKSDTKTLQGDIDSLGRWARTWGMRFQPVKCNIMSISRKIKHKIVNQYSLETTPLETLSAVKYLGVTIANDLKWNIHIANICNKANRTLGLLKINLGKCSLEIKDSAYKGLIRPVLEYS